MAELRLVGSRLRAVRWLTENPITRAALWRMVRSDFKVAELEALGREFRGRVEEIPKPVQGAAPRSFGDGGLATPETKRCNGEALRAAYAEGSLTPTQVLEWVLDREARRDFGPSTYSPWVALDEQGAREAAAASTQRWKAGRPLSVLDGIIVPIKDEFHMTGLPTRGGTSWRNSLATEDAWLVKRLREAGAILLGKVHCTESGLNPLGFNTHFDYCRNVYDAERGAGGSSTGSAVSVGLGMAPVAISTDGGGSIRIPASINGLYGLKPSFQRFGGSGDIWVGTVGHTGPIGQTVSDLVDLMEVCAAPDPGDPMTAFPPDWDHVVATWRPAMARGVKGCRIGVLQRFFSEADPAVARLVESALHALAREGAELVDVDFPILEVVNAVGPLVIAGESAANNCDDLADFGQHFGEELRMVYGLMKCVSAQQHLRATRVRTRLRHDLAEAFRGVDLLALPTTGRVASPYKLSENRVDVADTAYTASMTAFNFLANLTGVPAGTAPVGMHEGLPVGLQLVGDAWDEASVIAGLAHLERMEVTNIAFSPGYRDPRP